MRKLIGAGLVTLINKQCFAQEPCVDVANSLFYPRKGKVKHWTDKWAYFPYTRTPGWSTPVSLVYCKLVSMTTHSLTERGLAKLLGISRDAVSNALNTLISLHKIVVHPVPDEACSFFLIVRDFSLDDDAEAPEQSGEEVEEPVEKVEEPVVKVEVTETPKPKLSRYEDFVQYCKLNRGFPDYSIPQLYEFENKLGLKRFNEILDRACEEHERKKKLDPDRYYGTCHALLLHRLRKEFAFKP
jgi:DNA-binding transcriptional regulator GbsR (MarR family)